MDPLANSKSGVEQQVRGKLKELAEQVPTLGAVYTRRRRVPNVEKWLRMVGYSGAPQDPKARRGVFIYPEGMPENGSTAGICIVATFTYRVIIYHSVFDGDDDYNSYDELIKAALDFTDVLDANQNLGIEAVTLTNVAWEEAPIWDSQGTEFGTESDRLDLVLTVRIN